VHLQHRGGGRGVRVRRDQASRLFDLPLNIEVEAEFFNVKVVDEVFVFAAIRLLLRGCRAPSHSSRLQDSDLCTYI
jgi:hypothetical protein